MVIAGGIFHYPEIVSGEVTISTETPPITISAPKSEYLSELKAVDGKEVSAGDLLAVFPSTAEYQDVLQLEKDLETIGQLDLEKLQNYRPNPNLKLGELAQAYSSFVTAFEIVPLTSTGEIDYATVVAVENSNSQLQRQLNALEATLPSLRNEAAALETEKRNAARLYANTTDTTYTAIIYKFETQLKSKQAEIKKALAKMEDIKGEISKSNVRKLQAQTQAKAGAGEAIFQLNQRLDDLKKAVKNWKDNFLIIAPGDGTVQFYTDLKEGQSVTAGDILFNILPTERGGYVGKVTLPVDKANKVEKGMLANIKFVKYPFREYGTVPAKVSKVYPIAKDNAFYADIILEKGLVTNSNRELEFYQNMNGRAEIITDDRSFISKLFEKFTAMF